MTGAGSPVAQRGALPGDEELPFSPALLDDVFRHLDRAVRARQLYLGNNPTYQRALDGARSAFAALWAVADEVTLQVTDTHFSWRGTSVHEQPGKASDSLPWLLFKDGLRELTLRAGFEQEELEALVQILPRVRRAQQDEDDLITLLWERDFAYMSYRHVEVADESLPLPSPAEPPGQQSARDDQSGEPTQTAGEPTQSEVDRSGVVSMEDFDSTLYFLDDQEIQYIKTEIAREYSEDLRRTVLEILLDIFEQQNDAGVRDEVIDLTEQMVLHLLSAGQFPTVAFLLGELAGSASRANGLSGDQRARLIALPSRLSDPTTLNQVLQQLEDSASLPPTESLAALFSELRPGALEYIFLWVSRTTKQDLRTLLSAAAARLASANTNDLSRAIAHPDIAAAIEAARCAGSLRTAAAVPALTKALAAPEKTLRHAAATALADIASPTALEALERALEDQDRDIRLVAVRAIAARVHRPALPRLTNIVKSRDMRSTDRTERIAFFEAYGALCGESGVPFLDGLLNGRGGLFSRRGDVDARVCAALALGQVGSKTAQDSLQRALAEKDPLVRNAVNRALRTAAP
jgi:hypothetical protein